MFMMINSIELKIIFNISTKLQKAFYKLLITDKLYLKMYNFVTLFIINLYPVYTCIEGSYNHRNYAIYK
jgi:hypothetical protein